jgi:hypothetical protein
MPSAFAVLTLIDTTYFTGVCRDELAALHCPMPPVLPTERIAHLSYGRRLLRCGRLKRFRRTEGVRMPTDG